MTRSLLAAVILLCAQSTSAEIKSVGAIELNGGIGLSRPAGLAFDPIRKEVWVRGSNTGNIVILDAGAREATASVEGFSYITDVVTDPPRDRVYVLESGYKISVLKASTKEKLHTIALSPHQGMKLAVDPAGRLFAALQKYDSALKLYRQKVARLNAETGLVEAEILLPAPGDGSIYYQKYLVAGASRVYYPRTVYSAGKWNSELFILGSETLSQHERIDLGVDVIVTAMAHDPRPGIFGYGQVLIGNQMGALIKVTPTNTAPSSITKYSNIPRSRGLAVDAESQLFFSLDYASSRIQRISLDSYLSDWSTATRANLQDLLVAPGQKTVFAANSAPSAVLAFHAETEAYLGAAELRRDTPVDVAIPEGSDNLFVTGGLSGGVMSINGITGAEDYFFQESYGEPSETALFPKLDRAYFLNSLNAYGSSLRVFDTQKRRIVYSPSNLYSVAGMDGHPENGTLVLSQTATPGNPQTSRLVVIDAALDAVTQTITLGASSLYPRGVAADPASQKAYVALYGANKVASVDLAKGEVIAQIPVGQYPQAVAVDAIWNRVYVANYGSDSVSVLDGKTDQVIATIAVGKGPRDVAVKRKGIRVYVLNSGDGTLTVIDGRTLETVATLPLAGLPRKIRVDQAAEKIYTTNFSSASLSVFEDDTPADSAAPVITHQPITGLQQESQSVDIQATVTDDDAVAVVSLTYWDPETGTTKTSVMENVSGDLYQASIPKDFMAMLGGDEVRYFIDAADFDGNGPAAGSTPGSAKNPNAFAVQRQIAKEWNYSFKKIFGGLYRMIPGPSPAIGEIRADHPGLEIATGNEEYWPLGNDAPGSPSGRWFVFGSNGTVVFWKNTENDEAHSSVNLFDLNGDGKLEMLGGTTSGNQLQAFDSQANWLWRYTLGSHHVSTPATLPMGPEKKPAVFGGSFDEFVRSIDGATGKLRWAFPVGSRIWSSAAVDDLDGDDKPEVVIADEGLSPTSKGVLYCLDADTGTVKWKFEISHAMRGSAALADIDGDGIKEVLIGAGDGNFYSLSGQTGAIEWSYKVDGEIQSSPAVGDLDGDGKPEVVFGGSDGGLHALRADGTVFWTKNLGSPIFSSPALAKRGPEKHLSVYIGTMGGKLLIIDGRDGSPITGFSVGAEIASSPSVADTDGDGKLEVYFQDRFGDLNDSFGDRFWALKDNGSSVEPFSREWPMFRRDPHHTGVYPWAPKDPAPLPVPEPDDETAPELAIEAPAVGGELKVSWDPIAKAAGYKLFRDGGFLASLSSTVLLDQGLTDGATYTYKVSAFDADGHEGPQAEISGVPHDLLPPDSKVTAPAAGTEAPGDSLTVSGTAVDFGVAGAAKVEIILRDITAKSEKTLLAEGTNAFGLLLEGLEPGHSYEAGSRATDNEGNVETLVDFVAFSMAPLAGAARACIKIPSEGKKLWGDAVTVVSTATKDAAKVVTQYRYRCDNTDDGKPGHNNPNPDSDDGTQPDCSEAAAADWVTIATDEKKPWAIYWNISDANVKTGTYDLRAVAYDEAGLPDPEPCRIWVILDDANADLVEDGNPAVDPNKEHKLTAKVSATQTQEIATADGTSVIIPEGTVEAGETIEIKTVPASAVVNLETKFVKLNPAGVFKEFTFTSGKTKFDKNLTVTLPIPDADGDGIVDGTKIPVNQLKAYYFDETAKQWIAIGNSLKVGLSGLSAGSRSSASGFTFQVDHFTLFGLFQALEEKEAHAFGEVYSFPNPARPGQMPTLHIEAGPAENVEISIYDAAGQLVHSATIPGPPSTIDDGQGPEQAFEYVWDTGMLGSGAYSFVVTAKQAGAGKIRTVRRASLIR